jgi:NAD(P)-dependent dehydrogenase (short-subunit alcohol dehydrogenase family)
VKTLAGELGPAGIRVNGLSPAASYVTRDDRN